ncbi:hypothetical protein BESB_045150 [Besnoitia besnoiti]|uniref:Clu domain-containing protein n=1 Tax=Besnoitia besnoiti TaxID=94643 RepID=A0A2A9MKW0_BESBE|nr:hypothetical protein BESB_045150 [Besnoitia besnoiti]PFH36323.1 hypothetical protein BESB_045150 [Besnoitia besnoiti]
MAPGTDDNTQNGRPAIAVMERGEDEERNAGDAAESPDAVSEDMLRSGGTAAQPETRETPEPFVVVTSYPRSSGPKSAALSIVEGGPQSCQPFFASAASLSFSFPSWSPSLARSASLGADSRRDTHEDRAVQAGPRSVSSPDGNAWEPQAEYTPARTSRARRAASQEDDLEGVPPSPERPVCAAAEAQAPGRGFALPRRHAPAALPFHRQTQNDLRLFPPTPPLSVASLPLPPSIPVAADLTDSDEEDGAPPPEALGDGVRDAGDEGSEMASNGAVCVVSAASEAGAASASCASSSRGECAAEEEEMRRAEADAPRVRVEHSGRAEAPETHARRQGSEREEYGEPQDSDADQSRDAGGDAGVSHSPSSEGVPEASREGGCDAARGTAAGAAIASEGESEIESRELDAQVQSDGGLLGEDWRDAAFVRTMARDGQGKCSLRVPSEEGRDNVERAQSAQSTEDADSADRQASSCDTKKGTLNFTLFRKRLSLSVEWRGVPEKGEDVRARSEPHDAARCASPPHSSSASSIFSFFPSSPFRGRRQPPEGSPSSPALPSVASSSFFPPLSVLPHKNFGRGESDSLPVSPSPPPSSSASSSSSYSLFPRFSASHFRFLSGESDVRSSPFAASSALFSRIPSPSKWRKGSESSPSSRQAAALVSPADSALSSSIFSFSGEFKGRKPGGQYGSPATPSPSLFYTFFTEPDSCALPRRKRGRKRVGSAPLPASGFKLQVSSRRRALSCPSFSSSAFQRKTREPEGGACRRCPTRHTDEAAPYGAQEPSIDRLTEEPRSVEADSGVAAQGGFQGAAPVERRPCRSASTPSQFSSPGRGAEKRNLSIYAGAKIGMRGAPSFGPVVATSHRGPAVGAWCTGSAEKAKLASPQNDADGRARPDASMSRVCLSGCAAEKERELWKLVEAVSVREKTREYERLSSRALASKQDKAGALAAKDAQRGKKISAIVVKKAGSLPPTTKVLFPIRAKQQELAHARGEAERRGGQHREGEARSTGGKKPAVGRLEKTLVKKAAAKERRPLPLPPLKLFALYARQELSASPSRQPVRQLAAHGEGAQTTGECAGHLRGEHKRETEGSDVREERTLRAHPEDTRTPRQAPESRAVRTLEALQRGECEAKAEAAACAAAAQESGPRGEDRHESRPERRVAESEESCQEDEREPRRPAEGHVPETSEEPAPMMDGGGQQEVEMETNAGEFEFENGTNREEEQVCGEAGASECSSDQQHQAEVEGDPEVAREALEGCLSNGDRAALTGEGLTQQEEDGEANNGDATIPRAPTLDEDSGRDEAGGDAVDEATPLLTGVAPTPAAEPFQESNGEAEVSLGVRECDPTKEGPGCEHVMGAKLGETRDAMFPGTSQRKDSLPRLASPATGSASFSAPAALSFAADSSSPSVVSPASWSLLCFDGDVESGHEGRASLCSPSTSPLLSPLSLASSAVRYPPSRGRVCRRGAASSRRRRKTDARKGEKARTSRSEKTRPSGNPRRSRASSDPERAQEGGDEKPHVGVSVEHVNEAVTEGAHHATPSLHAAACLSSCPLSLSGQSSPLACSFSSSASASSSASGASALAGASSSACPAAFAPASPSYGSISSATPAAACSSASAWPRREADALAVCGRSPRFVRVASSAAPMLSVEPLAPASQDGKSAPAAEEATIDDAAEACDATGKQPAARGEAEEASRPPSPQIVVDVSEDERADSGSPGSGVLSPPPSPFATQVVAVPSEESEDERVSSVRLECAFASISSGGSDGTPQPTASPCSLPALDIEEGEGDAESGDRLSTNINVVSSSERESADERWTGRWASTMPDADDQEDGETDDVEVSLESLRSGAEEAGERNEPFSASPGGTPGRGPSPAGDGGSDDDDEVILLTEDACEEEELELQELLVPVQTFRARTLLGEEEDLSLRASFALSKLGDDGLHLLVRDLPSSAALRAPLHSPPAAAAATPRRFAPMSRRQEAGSASQPQGAAQSGDLARRLAAVEDGGRQEADDAEEVGEENEGTDEERGSEVGLAFQVERDRGREAASQEDEETLDLSGRENTEAEGMEYRRNAFLPEDLTGAERGLRLRANDFGVERASSDREMDALTEGNISDEEAGSHDMDEEEAVPAWGSLPPLPRACPSAARHSLDSLPRTPSSSAPSSRVRRRPSLALPLPEAEGDGDSSMFITRQAETAEESWKRPAGGTEAHDGLLSFRAVEDALREPTSSAAIRPAPVALTPPPVTALSQAAAVSADSPLSYDSGQSRGEDEGGHVRELTRETARRERRESAREPGAARQWRDEAGISSLEGGQMGGARLRDRERQYADAQRATRGLSSPLRSRHAPSKKTISGGVSGAEGRGTRKRGKAEATRRNSISQRVPPQSVSSELRDRGMEGRERETERDERGQRSARLLPSSRLRSLGGGPGDAEALPPPRLRSTLTITEETDDEFQRRVGMESARKAWTNTHADGDDPFSLRRLLRGSRLRIETDEDRSDREASSASSPPVFVTPTAHGFHPSSSSGSSRASSSASSSGRPRASLAEAGSERRSPRRTRVEKREGAYGFSTRLTVEVSSDGSVAEDLRILRKFDRCEANKPRWARRQTCGEAAAAAELPKGEEFWCAREKTAEADRKRTLSFLTIATDEDEGEAARGQKSAQKSLGHITDARHFRESANSLSAAPGHELRGEKVANKPGGPRGKSATGGTKRRFDDGLASSRPGSRNPETGAAHEQEAQENAFLEDLKMHLPGGETETGNGLWTPGLSTLPTEEGDQEGDSFGDKKFEEIVHCERVQAAVSRSDNARPGLRTLASGTATKGAAGQDERARRKFKQALVAKTKRDEPGRRRRERADSDADSDALSDIIAGLKAELTRRSTYWWRSAMDAFFRSALLSSYELLGTQGAAGVLRGELPGPNAVSLLSSNWHDRLQWSFRQVVAEARSAAPESQEQLADKELLLCKELGYFTAAARAAAVVLSYAYPAGDFNSASNQEYFVSDAPESRPTRKQKLKQAAREAESDDDWERDTREVRRRQEAQRRKLGVAGCFVQVTPQNLPAVWRVYRPKFDDDKVFVFDSLVLTVVHGSRRQGVSTRSARKIYANDYKGRQAAASVIYEMNTTADLSADGGTEEFLMSDVHRRQLQFARGAEDPDFQRTDYALPVCALVDYCGQRIMVEPLMPIAPEPTNVEEELVECLRKELPFYVQQCKVRGSEFLALDAIDKIDRMVNQKFRFISKSLNLLGCPFAFGHSDFAQSCRMPRAQLWRSRVDQLCVLRNLHEFLPPTVSKGAVHPTWRLRERFVRQIFDAPLPSTASAPWSGAATEEKEFSKFTRIAKPGSGMELLETAHEALEECVQDDLVPSIEALCVNFLDSADVSHALHEQGINMRSLGLVYNQCSGSVFRDAALREMLARAAKHLFLKQVEVLVGKKVYRKVLWGELLQSAVVALFNVVLGTTEETRSFWQEQLLPEVAEVFGVDLVGSVSPRNVCLLSLFKAMEFRMGVKFEASVLRKTQSGKGEALVLQLPFTTADLCPFTSCRDLALFPHVDFIRSLVTQSADAFASAAECRPEDLRAKGSPSSLGAGVGGREGAEDAGSDVYPPSFLDLEKKKERTKAVLAGVSGLRETFSSSTLSSDDESVCPKAEGRGDKLAKDEQEDEEDRQMMNREKELAALTKRMADSSGRERQLNTHAQTLAGLRAVRGFFPQVQTVLPGSLGIIRTALGQAERFPSNADVSIETKIHQMKAGLTVANRLPMVYGTAGMASYGLDGAIRASILGVAYPCHPHCMKSFPDAPTMPPLLAQVRERVETNTAKKDRRSVLGHREERHKKQSQGGKCLVFEGFRVSLALYLTVHAMVASDIVTIGKIATQLAYVLLQHGETKQALAAADYIQSKLPDIGFLDGDARLIQLQCQVKSRKLHSMVQTYKELVPDFLSLEGPLSLRLMLMELLLAAVAFQQKQYTAVIPSGLKVYHASALTVNPNGCHWTGVAALRLIGKSLMELQCYSEAITVLEDAVRGGQRDASLPSFVTCMNRYWLAVALSKVGRFQDAKEKASEALHQLEDQLGTNHPATLSSLFLVAELDQTLGCEELVAPPLSIIDGEETLMKEFGRAACEDVGELMRYRPIGPQDLETIEKVAHDRVRAKCRQNAVKLFTSLFGRLFTGDQYLYVTEEQYRDSKIQRKQRLLAAVKHTLMVKMCDLPLPTQRILAYRLYVLCVSQSGSSFLKRLVAMDREGLFPRDDQEAENGPLGSPSSKALRGAAAQDGEGGQRSREFRDRDDALLDLDDFFMFHRATSTYGTNVVSQRNVLAATVKIDPSELPIREHGILMMTLLVFARPSPDISEVLEQCVADCRMESGLVPAAWFDRLLARIIEENGTPDDLVFFVSMLRTFYAPIQKRIFLFFLHEECGRADVNPGLLHSQAAKRELYIDTVKKLIQVRMNNARFREYTKLKKIREKNKRDKKMLKKRELEDTALIDGTDGTDIRFLEYTIESPDASDSEEFLDDTTGLVNSCVWNGVSLQNLNARLTEQLLHQEFLEKEHVRDIGALTRAARAGAKDEDLRVNVERLSAADRSLLGRGLISGRTAVRPMGRAAEISIQKFGTEGGLVVNSLPSASLAYNLDKIERIPVQEREENQVLRGVHVEGGFVP